MECPQCPYSELWLDHFNNPRNVGTLDKNDPNVGTGIAGSPACGDTMRVQINVKDGVVVDVKFKTCGCGAAIAASSLATEKIKGKTVEEALALDNKKIADELSLPAIKSHCSVLAKQAISAAVEDLEKKNSPCHKCDIECPMIDGKI